MPSRGTGDPRLKTWARKQLRNRKAVGHPPCWKCGQPIDYSAPAGSPLAYELDEIVPRYLGGDPLDPSNTAPAHARCNRVEGARVGAAITNGNRVPSRPTAVEADEW